MKEKILYIGSDHRGVYLKNHLVNFLKSYNYEVIDEGTLSDEKSVDYPDFAHKVAKQVSSSGNKSFGILICYTGIGMSIAANKTKGVRAALCHDIESAGLARKHNDANILVLGSGNLSKNEASEMVKIFLETKFDEGRHVDRVNKIDKP